MTKTDWRNSGPAYGFASKNRTRKTRAGNKNNKRRGVITTETIIRNTSNREGNSSTKSRGSILVIVII
jgi:hypothetical protein